MVTVGQWGLVLGVAAIGVINQLNPLPGLESGGDAILAALVAVILAGPVDDVTVPP